MNIIGVTGASGYVGTALVKAGAVPIFADVTRPAELRDEIESKRPDVILHLAAKSDPDWCEDPRNKDILSDVNIRGVHNIFHHATILGIPCVLMSTGQIWKGGFWERPHRENDKPTDPVNKYGLSKLCSEAIVREIFFGSGGKIVRSSFVFDTERLAKKIGSLKEGVTLQEPTFIRRSFIYLQDIVELLFQYCERINEMPDILHLAGRETVSWHEFTRELACQYELDMALVEARSKEIESYVPRPHNAGLNTNLARSLGFRIPNYKEGIRRMRDG